MDILMWLHQGVRTIPGGHQTQMDETARALRNRGHRVEVSLDPKADPGGFDVVHGLGLDLLQAEATRRAGVPLVMSTIWWPLAYVNGAQAPLDRAKVTRQARRVLAHSWWRVSGQGKRLPGAEARQVYPLARVLLPNGPSEGSAVRRDLRVSTPIHSVPNAIDPVRYSPSTEPREDFILAVGRIEPHKNQLGTLMALRDQARPVYVVGHPHPHHRDYVEQVRASLRGQDRLLTDLPGDELVAMYRRAAVHVLNSWFETTGLSSLEAAACGAPVVSTQRGFARDYFGDQAAYCDPARPARLSGIVDAAAHRASTGLSEHVRSSYTWERAAAATELAYLVAMGDRPMTDLSLDLSVAPV